MNISSQKGFSEPDDSHTLLAMQLRHQTSYHNQADQSQLVQFVRMKSLDYQQHKCIGTRDCLSDTECNIEKKIKDLLLKHTKLLLGAKTILWFRIAMILHSLEYW